MKGREQRSGVGFLQHQIGGNRSVICDHSYSHNRGHRGLEIKGEGQQEKKRKMLWGG